jgi:hypothetical protein
MSFSLPTLTQPFEDISQIPVFSQENSRQSGNFVICGISDHLSLLANKKRSELW